MTEGRHEYPTATYVSSAELKFDHGHLFACQGGCDIPIHSCAEAVAAERARIAAAVRGLELPSNWSRFKGGALWDEAILAVVAEIDRAL